MGHDLGHDLHEPDGAVIAAAVVLHPHPAMGGDRHHPLVVAVAERLAGTGVAALRLDLHDSAVDVAAAALGDAAGELRAALGVDRLLLVGYSWGAAVAARATPAQLASRVLVAPPVTLLELSPQSEPALVLVPAHDQYGPPSAAEAVFTDWPDATLEVVEGCDHFLAGAVGRISERVVGWLADGT
jgi:alpha/beta superfamily hydrolase